MGVEHLIKTDDTTMSAASTSPDQYEAGPTRSLSRQNSMSYRRRPSAGNIYGRSSCKVRPPSPEEDQNSSPTEISRRSSGRRSVSDRSSFGQTGSAPRSPDCVSDTSSESSHASPGVHNRTSNGHVQNIDQALRNSREETTPTVTVTLDTSPNNNHDNQVDTYDVTSNLLSVPDELRPLGPTRKISTSRNPLDTSEMEQVKKMATRLNLETRRPSVFRWRGEVKDLLNGRRLPRTSSVSSDTQWKNLGDVLSYLREELFAMRQQDQELARTLVSLRREIQIVKLQKSYAAHQEIIEEAMEIEEERDGLAELCDDLPDQFSPTLKNFGVTRMNINSRRFSVF